MYFHLGRDYVLNTQELIGIFNLETTTTSPRGREFLNLCAENGSGGEPVGRLAAEFCGGPVRR